MGNRTLLGVRYTRSLNSCFWVSWIKISHRCCGQSPRSWRLCFKGRLVTMDCWPFWREWIRLSPRDYKRTSLWIESSRNPTTVWRSRGVGTMDTFTLWWKWNGRCSSYHRWVPFKTSFCTTASLRNWNSTVVWRSRSMGRMDPLALWWEWEGRRPRCDWFLPLKTNWCTTAPPGNRDSLTVWRPRCMERLDSFSLRRKRIRQRSSHASQPFLKTSCWASKFTRLVTLWIWSWSR